MHGLVVRWPGVDCPRPTGAFYVFPDLSALFGRRSAAGTMVTSSMSVASALLDEAGVAVVPGEGFLGCGGNHVRLSFACGEADIREGCARIEAWIEGLA